MNDPAIVPSACLEALYIEHHGWLSRWLRQRLGSSSDAADLAQDTFMRLLARDDMPAVREPRALLTVVARGLVSNHLRRRRVEQAYLAALAQRPAPQAPDPQTRYLVLETLVELDRRLDTLTPTIRRAFLLSQLDGMKQAEIATTLGLSLATVQRHIARAAHLCIFGIDLRRP